MLSLRFFFYGVLRRAPNSSGRIEKEEEKCCGFLSGRFVGLMVCGIKIDSWSLLTAGCSILPLTSLYYLAADALVEPTVVHYSLWNVEHYSLCNVEHYSLHCALGTVQVALY